MSAAGTLDRIHVMGASGSGTSELGRLLSVRLGSQWLETDDVFWAPSDPPFMNKRPVEDCLALMEERLRGERWVLSGSLDGWGDGFIPRFSLVVFLYAPTEVRLHRLRARQRQRFGDAIAPGGAMHARHMDFLSRAACYDGGRRKGRKLKDQRAWLARLACPVLELDAVRPVATLADMVMEHGAGGHSLR